MMMDAVEYFAAVEEAREARKPLSEVDRLFLEEAEEQMKKADVQLRGNCRSCGDPIPHFAGFCGPCFAIEITSNLRKSRELGCRCIDCGADISHRGYRSYLCELCAPIRHTKQQRESNTRRQMLAKGAVA